MRKLEGRVEVCRDLIVKWTEKENLLYVSPIIEICLSTLFSATDQYFYIAA